LPISTYAQQQAAFRRTNEKIAVEHEADAAEHLDLRKRLDAGQRGTDCVCQLKVRRR
jgi:hypothetical protein